MRLSTSSRWVYKAGIATLLSFVLFLPDADALSFFRRKEEPPARSLPPATQAAPDLIQPHEQGEQDTSREEPGEGEKHDETLQLPEDPLQLLVRNRVFPEDAATRSTPVTRGELASILVKALDYDTTLVSLFPFYRDVPRQHPLYTPIEVARAKKLLTYDEDQGFYHPEQPVTYAEVYRSMSLALTEPEPTPDAMAQLLAPFPDRDSLSEDLKSAIAKLVRGKVLTGDLKTIRLNPDEPVMPVGLAPMVASLMHQTENREPLVSDNVQEAGALVLPAGLGLTVTPASSIFENRISIGGTLYFSLVYDVDPLPKGSRVAGRVREVLEPRTYVVELEEVETPEGKVYQTSAELSILFPPKEKLSFIVPGEVFDTTTRLPAGVQPVSPGRPPGQSPGSSGNTSERNSDPR